ncbi:hypothetical protein G647_02715 [Cladophialophora carrionii CBS 160.54]|uniref:Uncharacterized protein n=1 Tax=Cladophialophora carrionii CBS 160.54 TaxID=1279043 RepID=V9DI00_9EURO|nr:uncharacterized protein G647_02715 [Cladophialophora carrionii CBS 160.54]ETI25938.1 hypothetical protein G647_02715 [Cladophialophora carrionii CBS 160.54]
MRPLASCNARTSRLIRLPSVKVFPPRPRWVQRHQHTASESRLPRLAQPGFWDLIIPKSLRGHFTRPGSAAPEKPTNPATFFIWIYILIGSQAIRIMSLKNEFMAYSRKADVKIQQLREVVEKLQRGEEVDVEKILGTGDETQEREWEEALEELQREDRVWQENRERSREDKERLARKEQDANPVNDAQDRPDTTNPLPSPDVPLVARRPEFY